ncbi:MAG: hypothetical protein ACREF9_13890, partial [Opitutaceae bacterium]
AELVQKVRREFDGIAGETLVAIAWNMVGADLDIHHFYRGDHSVSFHNPAHQGIRYLGDVLAGGGGKWEILSYNSMPSADAQLYINLYSSNDMAAGPRQGVLLLRHRGRDIIEKTFVVANTRGDGGANVAARATDPNWVKIDLTTELRTP